VHRGERRSGRPNGEVYLLGQNNSVYEYAADATGRAAPIRTITLPALGKITVGPDGTLYVAGTTLVGGQSETATIYVVLPGQTSYTRTIGPFVNETTAVNPVGGLAVDRDNELYVGLNASPGGTSVNVYAPGANGNAAPVRTLLSPVPPGTPITSLTIFQ
jgi:hypothetical protein